MVHKQNKEKKMKGKNFYYTKKRQNNPTHTNSQNSECGHLFSHNHTFTLTLKQILTLTNTHTHVT